MHSTCHYHVNLGGLASYPVIWMCCRLGYRDDACDGQYGPTKEKNLAILVLVDGRSSQPQTILHTSQMCQNGLYFQVVASM